jgi:aromatic-L-amino-acid decarboxylase
MDQQLFKEFGYKFVDWVADYMAELEKLPVLSQVKPGEIRNKLPPEPPAKGEPMETVFNDFKEIILPGITHWQHPSWYAYFPATNSPPSVLAELLTAALGAQCMIWQTSPAAAELEEVVLEWLRQMLGLPEGMAGVIQDTASTATLVALLTARENATNFKANQEGLKKPLVIYASEETHSSIEKGAKIAGYGRENIRYIPTDESFAMIPSKLEEAVDRDKKNGFEPACVVATLGTTSSTAIDPLAAIGKICRRHSLWLHVDAAFAGTAAILPEKKSMLEGAEYVDSFVFNPHKWMLTNFDLWFVIRSYGVEGLQKIVREHIRLAQRFKDWVEEHEDFEIMAPVSLSLVCFRLNDGRDEEALHDLNRRLLESLNQTGKVFLTHTSLRGKYVLRLSIGSRTTEERHIREAWELIKTKAAEVLK